MGSAKALQDEWIPGETTDLCCSGLPLEMLAVLRNGSMESCGHVGWAEGNGQDVCIPGVLGEAACPILGPGELLLHIWRYVL